MFVYCVYLCIYPSIHYLFELIYLIPPSSKVPGTPLGLPDSADGKESVYSAESRFLSLGRKDALEKGMLQCSCLDKNPMDRGTCKAAVHGVAEESDTTE